MKLADVVAPAQAAGVAVSAVVYPACACGHAYTAHACACGCPGYAPAAPVRDLGLRAYAPPPGLPLPRLVACRLLWRAEARLQRWRERTEQRGRS